MYLEGFHTFLFSRSSVPQGKEIKGAEAAKIMVDAENKSGEQLSPTTGGEKRQRQDQKIKPLKMIESQSLNMSILNSSCCALSVSC